MPICIACAWRRAADSGITPTPTPASTMRHAPSKLLTSMRSFRRLCRSSQMRCSTSRSRRYGITSSASVRS